MRETESPKYTTWPDTWTIQQRVESLSLATIAEMRKIPFIPFPDDSHLKAVEFAMIVRNEFTKRLQLELTMIASNADPVLTRVRFRKTLAVLREEIVQMASHGSGWLETQLEHSLKDGVKDNVAYDWSDSYLDALLMSIGV